MFFVRFSVKENNLRKQRERYRLLEYLFWRFTGKFLCSFHLTVNGFRSKLRLSEGSCSHLLYFHHVFVFLNFSRISLAFHGNRFSKKIVGFLLYFNFRQSSGPIELIFLFLICIFQPVSFTHLKRLLDFWIFRFQSGKTFAIICNLSLLQKQTNEIRLIFFE